MIHHLFNGHFAPTGLTVFIEGAYPLYHCKWHKKRPNFSDKPSTLYRRRRWIDSIRKKGQPLYGSDPDLWWADDFTLGAQREATIKRSLKFAHMVPDC